MLNRLSKDNKYKITRFIVILLFMLSVAQNVDFYLKYQRIQELYIETTTKVNIKNTHAADNKEYQSLNQEVLKDINKKAGGLNMKGIINNSDLGAITESAFNQIIANP